MECNALQEPIILNSSLPHKDRTDVRRARHKEHEHRRKLGCRIGKKGNRGVLLRISIIQN